LLALVSGVVIIDELRSLRSADSATILLQTTHRKRLIPNASSADPANASRLSGWLACRLVLA
jgi:hypothetical protein